MKWMMMIIDWLIAVDVSSSAHSDGASHSAHARRRRQWIVAADSGPRAASRRHPAQQQRHAGPAGSLFRFEFRSGSRHRRRWRGPRRTQCNHWFFLPRNSTVFTLKPKCFQIFTLTNSTFWPYPKILTNFDLKWLEFWLNPKLLTTFDIKKVKFRQTLTFKPNCWP